MNSEATKDSGVKIIASGKFAGDGIFYSGREIEVTTVLLNADLSKAYLNTEPHHIRYGYDTENEYRHYASNRAELRAAIEAEIHEALEIFADYEYESVIIKHVVGNVFAVAHVKAPPAEDAEEDGGQ
ncbi:MAG: hypothetical protein LBK23_05040 [Oscillospiraceae bacterium]|jgi:hypothetical protein|nr:hypothetical protein [Oscillospiraceae bacterium]